MSTNRKLSGVHPDLVRKVEAIIRDCRGHGYRVVVVEGLRSKARQRALYEQGRSTPGRIVTNTLKSMHLAQRDGFGHAVDMCPADASGKLIWDAEHPAWQAIGSSARAHGLVWGGDWKRLKDMPHVELPLQAKEK